MKEVRHYTDVENMSSYGEHYFQRANGDISEKMNGTLHDFGKKSGELLSIR